MSGRTKLQILKAAKKCLFFLLSARQLFLGSTPFFKTSHRQAMNLYQILGVSENATSGEIRMAYKRLAFQYHPDRNPDNPEAEEILKAINGAYEVLSSHERRARYDLLLSYQQFETTTSSTADPTSYDRKYGTAHHYTTEEESARPSSSWYTAEDRARDEKRALIIIVRFIAVIIVLVVAHAFTRSYLENSRIAEQEALYTAVFGDAMTYYEQQNFRACLLELDAIIARQPNETQAHLFRQRLLGELRKDANQHFERKDYRKSLEYLLIIREFESVFGMEFYYRLSECYRQLKDYPASIEVLQYVLKISDREVFAYHQLALIHRDAMREEKKALTFFDKAIQVMIDDYRAIYGEAYPMLINPQKVPELHTSVFHERARLRLQMGNVQAALKDLSWLEHLRPGHPPYLFTKGECLLKIGRRAEACRTWETAASKGYTAALESLKKFCQ